MAICCCCVACRLQLAGKPGQDGAQQAALTWPTNIVSPVTTVQPAAAASLRRLEGLKQKDLALRLAASPMLCMTQP